VCGTGSPCTKVNQDEGWNHFALGPPYVNTRTHTHTHTHTHPTPRPFSVQAWANSREAEGTGPRTPDEIIVLIDPDMVFFTPITMDPLPKVGFVNVVPTD
jgi:hypothetical protein